MKWSNATAVSRAISKYHFEEVPHPHDQFGASDRPHGGKQGKGYFTDDCHGVAATSEQIDAAAAALSGGARASCYPLRHELRCPAGSHWNTTLGPDWLGIHTSGHSGHPDIRFPNYLDR
jgi:hypothetical protein